MRFRLRSLTLVVIALPAAVMGFLAACGGDSTTGDGGSDATLDQTNDVAVDVKPDNTVVDAGCDAPDLASLIPAADAAVDAGGLAFGPCLGCLEAPSADGGCGTALNACNGECLCRQGVIDFATCLAQTQDLQGCGLAAISSGNQNLITLLGCAQQKCLATCAGTAGDGGADGGDAGPTDSGGGG